jgi:predicted Zn-dependent protease
MPSVIGARSWLIAFALALPSAWATAVAPICSAAAPLTASSQAGPRTGRADAARALAAGDSGRALELGTAYLRQHPGDPRARLLLARAHLDRDELDAAFVQLTQARRVAPQNVDVLYYLGLVTGQLAARQLESLVEKAPDSARAQQLRAESLDAQDRRAEAEAAYDAALRAKPDLLEALLGLAKLKRIRLDCDGAAALYTRAEAVRPTFDGAYGLGSCELRQQRPEAALPRFEQAVRRDPHAAVARVGLASAMLGVGRTADAIATLQRAVTLEPNMTEAWYLLGRAHQTAGNRTAAQEAFAKAEQLRTAPRSATPASTPPPSPREKR